MTAVRHLLPLVALVALVARADAQPAAAIGKPLPDAKLRDGTVMLRVIAGDANKPLSGLEATIMVTPPDGTSPAMTRRARTDTDGRVTFSDIAPDAMVQLKAPSEAAEGGEVTSSTFPMPAAGGVRVLLSTLPFGGGAMMPPGPSGPAGPGGPGGGPGAATGAPAAGGPPATPRAMSGQPRSEEGDAADSVTVRLSYDDFADPTPPAAQPVIIVGYRFDLHVAGRVVKSDAAGRAAFSGLDKRGATTYFSLALLPRGDDFDRLVSSPMILPGDQGLRVMLSGLKRGAAEVADDLGTIDPQPGGGVPAGEVQVALAGLVAAGDPVELLDALTGKVVATTKAGPPTPNADTLTATWDGSDDPTLATGVLVVVVDENAARAAGATIEVRGRPSTLSSPPPPVPAGPVAEARWSATADQNGEARLSGVPVGVDLDLIVTIGGMPVPARTVKLPATGGRHEQARVVWRPRGQGAARFTDVAPGPERAYLVRGYLRGQPCLSAPFQLTAKRGAAATVLIFPRLLFGFSLRASIHDIYLGVRGTFTLRNSSLAPYLPGIIGKPEDLVIPLPKGFVGGTVDAQFAGAVSVDPTRGFILRDPVPPGGTSFVGHFSLKTDNGEVTWHLDLPFGTLESGMEIKRTSGMEVDVPPPMAAGEAVDERGSWYVLSPISVQPKQSMVFKLTGLPRSAAWTRVSRIVVGLLVLLVVIAAISLALLRPPAATEATRSRFEELVDELAALGESSDPAVVRTRERLIDELEVLHRARGSKPGRTPGTDVRTEGR